jgi:hypothetical protein
MIALVEPLPEPSQIVSVRSGWVSKIIGVTDTHPRVGQYQNIVTNRFPTSPCTLIVCIGYAGGCLGR